MRTCENIKELVVRDQFFIYVLDLLDCFIATHPGKQDFFVRFSRF